MGSRKNIPLRCRVVQNVLTIEIGIDTLAHACLCSEYAFSLMVERQERPNTRFRIDNKRKFANEVAHELTDELGEDGSTLLTNLFDKACEKAIEQGSTAFVDTEEGQS